MALPLGDQGFALYMSVFWDAFALWHNCLPNQMPTRCACNEPFTVEHALSCPKGPFPIHCHNEIRDTTYSLLSEVSHNVTLEPTLQPLMDILWDMHPQSLTKVPGQTYRAKDSGEPLTNVHFLMSRNLTHTHHPTRGFPSLPVTPTMNKSNGACTSGGSTKSSWPPSLYSFSALLEAWANLQQCSMGVLLTRLPSRPNNHIPAPSHGSDACWIFHWSDHLCLVWEDRATTAAPDCPTPLHWQSGKPESDWEHLIWRNYVLLLTK